MRKIVQTIKIARRWKALVPMVSFMALRIRGLILLLLIAISLSSLTASAAVPTKSDCMEMGRAILATKNENEINHISSRIVESCNSSELSNLVTYFEDRGSRSLAISTANACVTLYPQEAICWLTIAVQYVHRQQADEAINAYQRFLALDEKTVNHAEHVKNVTAIIDRLRRLPK